MFTCNCCSPPKSYSAQKSLYRHQRLKGVTPSTVIEQQKIAHKADAPACKNCRKLLPFPNKGNKTFCTQSCAATYNNPRKPLRAVNGKNYKFGRMCKRPSCQMVINAQNSQFCSQKCCNEDKYQERIILWKNGTKLGATSGGQMSSTIRRYLHQQHNSSCSMCGWNKINPKSGKVPLQIDHIDGNPMNNIEANLRLICPNCHSLTPTYMALNRGNGRAYRRQRYADGKSQ